MELSETDELEPILRANKVAGPQWFWTHVPAGMAPWQAAGTDISPNCHPAFHRALVAALCAAGRWKAALTETQALRSLTDAFQEGSFSRMAAAHKEELDAWADAAADSQLARWCPLWTPHDSAVVAVALDAGAWEAHRTKRAGAALVFASEAVAAHPNHSDIRLHRARLALAAGRAGLAQDDCAAAMALSAFGSAGNRSQTRSEAQALLSAANIMLSGGREASFEPQALQAKTRATREWEARQQAAEALVSERQAQAAAATDAPLHRSGVMAKTTSSYPAQSDMTQEGMFGSLVLSEPSGADRSVDWGQFIAEQAAVGGSMEDESEEPLRVTGLHAVSRTSSRTRITTYTDSVLSMREADGSGRLPGVTEADVALARCWRSRLAESVAFHPEHPTSTASPHGSAAAAGTEQDPEAQLQLGSATGQDAATPSRSGHDDVHLERLRRLVERTAE
jgi:hypothetical protein